MIELLKKRCPRKVYLDISSLSEQPFSRLEYVDTNKLVRIYFLPKVFFSSDGTILEVQRNLKLNEVLNTIVYNNMKTNEL